MVVMTIKQAEEIAYELLKFHSDSLGSLEQMIEDYQKLNNIKFTEKEISLIEFEFYNRYDFCDSCGYLYGKSELQGVEGVPICDDCLEYIDI